MALDVPFSVPLVHRLRFTRDALDPANRTLADVLPADGRPRARALFFVDSGVAEARPDLPERIGAYAAAHGIELGGHVRTVVGGEACKNDPALPDELVSAIHDAGLCRRSYAVAIGGGAVLDTVGFAAAVAHRGVRLVRLPTTTLAQDDAGLGVKCGVNRFGKKNYLGAFAAPWAVVNDEVFLESLSDRDWRCGFSEALKVALLKDPALYERMRADAERIRGRDLAAALPVVRRSAELHLRHITEGGDPFEAREARPLDFGHWAAHRLESLTQHRLRHGEAVAIGMAIDNAYARLAGLLDPATERQVAECLRAMGLPTADAALADADSMLAGLEEFREHLGGRLTITLLRGVGEPVDVHQIDERMLREAIRFVHEERAGDGRV